MEEKSFYKNVQCVIVKKLRFLKEKEARGLLSNLTGAKIPILSGFI